MGGRGAFIALRGIMESGFTGMYVVEIPAGGALNPERHLYEEILYVLQGRGTAEVWQEGGPKKTIEWGEGSLLAPPLNTWHRLYSVSSEPAILLGVTSAPIVMDLFHNPEFVFGDSFVFADRYSGEDDYFTLDNRVERDPGEHLVWETNFIADLRTAIVDNRERPKGHRVSIMGFEIADNVFTGHISEWPVGIYHKAHYHGPGAVILGLNSHGYVLLWPKELGLTPFRDGYGDQVGRLNWGEGAVYAPPDGWFHQHFNTGREPARHIAFRTGGAKYRMGLRSVDRNPIVSVKEGGALLEYEDEDPAIRRDFEAALRAEGIASQMPEFVTSPPLRQR
jgi:quercetin dioxygenase-like cupin family protein